MLFWKYRIDFNHDNYKFYEFIKCYDKYNTENNHNKEHNVSGQNEIMAVLDGQQRLTALFIGLKGYMNLKKPRYRAGRAENYEKKFLYLNLLKNDRNTENEDLENKKDNLRSNLIILPVAQFLLQNNTTELDIHNMKLIENWVQRSILARVFSSQTTSYLNVLRKEITGWQNFPLQNILSASSKFGRSMYFDDDAIHELIDKAKYSTQLSWAILTILYPDNDYSGETFHEDHIYPQVKLSALPYDQQLDGNTVANLQLLKGRLNREKSDTMPEEWIEKHCKECNISINEYKNKNYIPCDIYIDEQNFAQYIKSRKELIFETLKQKLAK